MTTGVMIGYGLAVVVFIALLIAAFRIEDEVKGKKWFNLVFVLGGGLAGWTAGLLVIPLPGVPQKLTELGTVSAALVGGAVGTKLIDALTKKIENGLDKSFVGTSILFLSAFLLGGLSTVIWRLSGIS